MSGFKVKLIQALTLSALAASPLVGINTDKELKIALCNDVKEIAKEDDDYKNVLKKMN